MFGSGSCKGHIYLPDNSAFEDDKHEGGKETIVPVFVQAPESHTEKLKDKERSGSMFAEQFCERGDRNVEFVLPIKFL